jgi:hypothetical protein
MGRDFGYRNEAGTADGRFGVAGEMTASTEAQRQDSVRWLAAATSQAR